MDMHAVTVDGTGIEVDQLKLGRQGVKLQRHVTSDQSGDEVTVVFDDSVPVEERADLVEELETKGGEEAEKRERQSSQEKRPQSSETRSAERPETIGYVPYDRLLYVRPGLRVRPT